MKHLSVKDAAEQGYRAITNDLRPDVEIDKPIIKSIESTLESCDAVWIDMPYGAMQAGRKRSELILPEEVIKQLKSL